MPEIGKSSTKRKKNIISAAAAPTKFEEVSDNFKAVNPDKFNETSFVPSSHTTSSILLEGDAYHNFVDSIKSPSTLINYNFGLKKYMQHMKLVSVDDLLAQDVKTIESSIIKYIVSLRGLSFASRSLYLAAIIGFYTMNDVMLNKNKIGKYLGENIRKHRIVHIHQKKLRKCLIFATKG